MQNRVPKILVDGLAPASCPEQPELEDVYKRQPWRAAGGKTCRRRTTPVSAKNTGNTQGFWRYITMNSKRQGNGGERELLSILQADVYKRQP